MSQQYKDWSTGKVYKLGLPSFSMTFGEPSEARIYASHYDRLQALLAAARSENPLLIKLAVAHCDEHGSRE